MPRRTDRKAYPPYILSRAEFATLARRARSSITEACAGPLAPACNHDRIDAAHPAALAYLAKRPFQSDDDVPEGFLAPAMVGDEIDVDHPVARIFLALCGRAPSDELDAEISKLRGAA